jgi:hypothetical protein
MHRGASTPIGVLWLGLAILAAEAADAPAPNRASFTNLSGQAFLNVTIVRTNRGEIVFKQPGKFGFTSEKLTNLSPEVRWPFLAQERAAAAKEAQAVRQEFRNEVIRFGDWVEEAKREWENAKTTPSNQPAWKSLIKKTERHRAQMEFERDIWDDKVGLDDLKILDDWIATMATILEGAKTSHEIAVLESQKKAERERIARAAKEAADKEPWREEEIGVLERIEIYDQVTAAVKQRLRAPRTAVFDGPKSIKVEQRRGLRRVTGYVDSQNGFGALIRSVFVADIAVGKVTKVEILSD